MLDALKNFFRMTAPQRRGLAVLVVVLSLLAGAAAIKDCRGARRPVEVQVVSAEDGAAGSAAGKSGVDSLFVFDPSRADSVTFLRLGFTPAQARTILRFRASVGGRFRSAEQFARCYAVSDTMFARLAPYIRMEREGQETEREVEKTDSSAVDVNRASLKRLKGHVALDGILAEKIFRARVRYGGFVDLKQLCTAIPSDTAGLSRFARYAVFDTTGIVRYEVNRDSESLLSEHPYISRLFARQIVRYRNSYGSIPCFDSLRKIKYFPRSKADYLHFYLKFDPPENEDSDE